jgi:plastocyanin
MRKLVLLLALGALAPFALAACGGDDGDGTTAATTTTTQAGGGGGGEAISLSADASGALAFQETSLTGQAGQATIEFDNPAALSHDVCVEDSSGKELGCSDVIQEDKTTLDVDLEPGSYTYFCSVDGHEAAGMKGTLTVE